MAKRYKCPYCDVRLERPKLIEHIEKKHEELIPEGYTAARVVYDIANKTTGGRCRVCGKPTPWNESSGRYDVLCGDPKCKQHMRDEYKKNMLRVKGTYNILNDPEQQAKMLANRSISGTYKFSDGGEVTYTGSYERKCLEFMDVVMQIPSKDIVAPGPTLYYKYEGKDHFYITDFYYPNYNLIIEVKDGGDNPNMKDTPGMRSSRERTIEKEHLITDRGEYNYVRLTNNDFSQLIEVFMNIKQKLIEGIDTPTININESEQILSYAQCMNEYAVGNFNAILSVINETSRIVSQSTYTFNEAEKEDTLHSWYIKESEWKSKYRNRFIAVYKNAISKLKSFDKQMPNDTALNYPDKDPADWSSAEMIKHMDNFKGGPNDRSDGICTKSIMLCEFYEKDLPIFKRKAIKKKLDDLLNSCIPSDLKDDNQKMYFWIKNNGSSYILIANSIIMNETHNGYGLRSDVTFFDEAAFCEVVDPETINDAFESVIHTIKWCRMDSAAFCGILEYHEPININGNSFTAGKFTSTNRIDEVVRVINSNNSFSKGKYSASVNGNNELVITIIKTESAVSEGNWFNRTSAKEDTKTKREKLFKGIFSKYAGGYDSSRKTRGKYIGAYYCITNNFIVDSYTASSISDIIDGYTSVGSIKKLNEKYPAIWIEQLAMISKAELSKRIETAKYNNSEYYLKEYGIKLDKDKQYTLILNSEPFGILYCSNDKVCYCVEYYTEIYRSVLSKISLDELYSASKGCLDDYNKLIKLDKNIINEAASKINPNHKTKTGKKFRYFDLKDDDTDIYLKQNSYCRKYWNYIHNSTIGEIAVDVETDKLAGYVFVDNEKYPGFIVPIEVIKEYRGYGVGNQLLYDAIHKYGAIDLCVDKDNEVAIHLYKKHGFVIIGDGESKQQYWMKLKTKLTAEEKSKAESIQESKVFNKEDIYYNKDKFDSGEINLCFITGHSGSGKSTMAHDMEGSKIEAYELDDIIPNWNFSDSNLKEYGDLIYSFFKGPGKKFRYTSKKEWDEDKQWNNKDPYKDGYEVSLITAFVNYAMQYAKAHKDTKFVLEGVWIFRFINPSDLDPYAVYIKGTSMLISQIRAAKRDYKDTLDGFSRAKAITKQIAGGFKSYMMDEKKINTYCSHFESKIK